MQNDDLSVLIKWQDPLIRLKRNNGSRYLFLQFLSLQPVFLQLFTSQNILPDHIKLQVYGIARF